MRTSLAATLFLAMLLISGLVASEPSPVQENRAPEQVLLPASAPDRTRMNRVQSLTFIEGELGAGELVFFDDPRTRRPIDYIEFYDYEGNLLAISWIDHLGLCQAAVDRGLLDSEDPRIDGVVVIVEIGTEL